jgi:NADPH:quinone reductase-like Zn-dependent oxidoreductase
MRAAVVEAVGSPPRPAEVDDPVREDGTALVAVQAAPLNPVEIRVAAGRHPSAAQPPYVPGLEGSGTVLESSRVAPGTRVRFESIALPGFGTQGTLAERTAVPEDSLAELPDDVDDDLAAAVGVVGITALLALERAAPAGGERVLVLGATGAVGQMAVQLAKVMGAARVVGAGRSAERLERVRELGADDVVQLNDGDLTESFEIVRNRQGAIHAISSGWTGLAQKAAAYRRVVEHAAAGRLTVDRDVVPLDEVATAWKRQDASPGRKLVISIGQWG